MKFITLFLFVLVSTQFVWAEKQAQMKCDTLYGTSVDLKPQNPIVEKFFGPPLLSNLEDSATAEDQYFLYSAGASIDRRNPNVTWISLRIWLKGASSLNFSAETVTPAVKGVRQTQGATVTLWVPGDSNRQINDEFVKKVTLSCTL